MPPGTFQRLADAILFGIKGEYTYVYLDDILVFSEASRNI